MYASLLGNSVALHLDVFDQPEKPEIFKNLLVAHIRHHPSTDPNFLAPVRLPLEWPLILTHKFLAPYSDLV